MQKLLYQGTLPFFFFFNTFVIPLSCTVESKDLLAYFEEGILQLWKNT